MVLLSREITSDSFHTCSSGTTSRGGVKPHKPRLPHAPIGSPSDRSRWDRLYRRHCEAHRPRKGIPVGRAADTSQGGLRAVYHPRQGTSYPKGIPAGRGAEAHPLQGSPALILELQRDARDDLPGLSNLNGTHGERPTPHFLGEETDRFARLLRPQDI